MSKRINHQDIVKKALDTKAVDFAAVGKMIAELGPSVSLADDPGDIFCGTMRFFFHCYYNPFIDYVPIAGGSVESLSALRAAAGKTES